MYEMMNAHPVTMLIILASVMVTPFYVFAVYVFSGASPIKGAWIAAGFLLFGSFAFLICIADVPGRTGLPGQLIVPVLWTLPSLVLFVWRDWFLEKPLSQKGLIGLQLFRAIGAVFLIEMLRGNLPAIFAYPAGIGDVLVALIALVVLLVYRHSPEVPGRAVKLVILVGVLDFLSAFFFGFTSSETPLQLFNPEVTNNVILFPTGMIPLFLVPYAIFFHTLSALNLYRFERQAFRRDHPVADKPVAGRGRKSMPVRPR